MANSRLALWVLTRLDASGAQEALVGDVLEEIVRGRSQCWVWQQVFGCCGWALLAHARRHARLTPFVVAGALGVVLLGTASIASVMSVVQTWIALYLLAGTLSLLGHVMAGTAGSRTLTIPGEDPSRY